MSALDDQIDALVSKLASTGVKATHAVIHPSKRTPEIVEALQRAGLEVEWRDDVPVGTMLISDESGGRRR